MLSFDWVYIIRFWINQNINIFLDDLRHRLNLNPLNLFVRLWVAAPRSLHCKLLICRDKLTLLLSSHFCIKIFNKTLRIQKLSKKGQNYRSWLEQNRPCQNVNTRPSFLNTPLSNIQKVVFAHIFAFLKWQEKWFIIL